MINLMYFGEKNGKPGPQKVLVKVQYFNGGMVNEELEHIEKHSPDGFNWGYGGSGPADLAYAILVDFCDRRRMPENIPEKYYQEFKETFVVKFEEKFEIDDHVIGKWIDEKVKLCL